MPNVPKNNPRRKYGPDLSAWLMDMMHDVVWPRLSDGQNREPQWPEIKVMHLFSRINLNMIAAQSAYMHIQGADMSQAKKELTDVIIYSLMAIDNMTHEEEDDAAE